MSTSALDPLNRQLTGLPLRMCPTRLKPHDVGSVITNLPTGEVVRQRIGVGRPDAPRPKKFMTSPVCPSPLSTTGQPNESAECRLQARTTSG